ncbi:MAG: STAS domain-containing protein [Candidatus Eremiobacteraeota bacterium]|nr:STAS domain-containing protein [Candidatus Eremiobacteraeota bacterium]MBC5827925.1 STAS domain-containing protein [Candidatus Eremiobacteraeota bacterium]
MASQLSAPPLRGPMTALSGKFDIYRAEELRATLKEAEDRRIKTIDFSDVSFVDAASLGCLAGWKARMADMEVRLVGVRPHIARLFRIVGFDSLFSISEQLPDDPHYSFV